MPAPSGPPVGLRLARSAKAISRAFDDALSAAGGSLPTWLILISVKSRQLGNQRELADAVGIRGATLTHHLDAMEGQGLVERRRDPENRRIQRVQLTEAGEEAFQRLRRAAVAFDNRLRAGLSADEIDSFSRVLERLQRNVAADV